MLKELARRHQQEQDVARKHYSADMPVAVKALEEKTETLRYQGKVGRRAKVEHNLALTKREVGEGHISEIRKKWMGRKKVYNPSKD